MNSEIGSTVLGYPRIGPDRELKAALERYWAGTDTARQLRDTAAQLRADTWHELANAGLTSIPSNTFSYYDHVLDTALLLGAIPERYTNQETWLDTYFAMARGTREAAPLELTKWFNTNYHYLVPEIGPDTEFRLCDRSPVEQYREAREIGITTRPVVVGPVTFLLLAKPSPEAPASFHPLDRIDDVVAVYEELLAELHEAGVRWVQLDEPAFAADRSTAELAQLREVYQRLGALQHRPRLFTAVYFGGSGAVLRAVAETPVEAVSIDLISDGSVVTELATVPALRTKTLVAGAVDGRNVWRTDLDLALSTLVSLLGFTGELAVGTSCSLLHVPYDVEAETELDPRIRQWLSFARQKVSEVVTLHRALTEGRTAVAKELTTAHRAIDERRRSDLLRDARVRARTEQISQADRERVGFAQRHQKQANRLRLPPLPTTTIGSFPQTSEIRDTRARLRRGEIDAASYRDRMFDEIERVVRAQETLGLDVLVHGEPERDDMVSYFAEQLNGFASTMHGWVQSFGPHCVRPPILYGDVSRPSPITTDWSGWAQSLTTRHVKGMLTGPVTMLAWSFVRDDQAVEHTADQVALAVRDELADLENAGIGIVQVDEPALRERLPLHSEDHAEYLRWAINAFRLATSGVDESTQIHTHLCYSEFGPVIDAIADLDADVTCLEATRSRMEVLRDLNATGFRRGVGPGLYDIHSPRVPDVDEVEERLRGALRAIPSDRLWANPDCGLKTRDYDELHRALHNLVTAVRRVRSAPEPEPRA